MKVIETNVCSTSDFVSYQPYYQISATCNFHPYNTANTSNMGSIQSQLSFMFAKLSRLEAENEELKKAVAELIQSGYFD